MFDILRLLLAIVVVGIHARVFTVKWYPLCRLAVPLFFILSAYFVYAKIFEESGDGWSVIWSFVRRNAELYAFWVIVLLPYYLFVYKQRWFGTGWVGVYDSLKRIFIIGVQAYWFILAGIGAIVLSFVILKHIGEKALWGISIIGYLAAVVSSSHCYLMPHFPVIQKIYNFFVLVYERPEFTFIGALLWMTIGMWFARRKDGHSVISFPCIMFDAILCLFAIVLLIVEALYVRGKTGMGTCDMYASLPFAAYFVFRLVIWLKFILPNSRIFRDLSVALYMMHAPIIAMFVVVAKYLGYKAYGALTFGGTLSVCLILFFCINMLKVKKRFFWLKHAW